MIRRLQGCDIRASIKAVIEDMFMRLLSLKPVKQKCPKDDFSKYLSGL
jgi:hypothetical protein